jgi:hypothetical protein
MRDGAKSVGLRRVLARALHYFALLDKAPWPSLDYAFRNHARTLTSSLAAVKTISSRHQENHFYGD